MEENPLLPEQAEKMPEQLQLPRLKQLQLFIFMIGLTLQKWDHINLVLYFQYCEGK